MITVEDFADVSSFANYTVGSSPSSSVQTGLQTDEVAPPAVSEPPAPAPPLATSEAGRVVASPLARRLAREAQVSLGRVAGLGLASGPRGRVLGADVLQAVASGASSQETPTAPASASAATPVPEQPAAAAAKATPSPSTPGTGGGDVYASFQQHAASSGSTSSLIGALSSQSKKEVPHYYLSVEINVSKILSLRESLSENSDISVQDILVKAAAKAMEKVCFVPHGWSDNERPSRFLPF
jgi:pyruvate dehydrogenase E2 component (dihydrolipoamide acetyltransferase)